MKTPQKSLGAEDRTDRDSNRVGIGKDERGEIIKWAPDTT